MVNSLLSSYVKMKTIRNGPNISGIISKGITEYLNKILNIILNMLQCNVLLSISVEPGGTRECYLHKLFHLKLWSLKTF